MSNHLIYSTSVVGTRQTMSNEHHIVILEYMKVVNKQITYKQLLITVYASF